MRAYQILHGANIEGLQCIDYPERALGLGEVRIRVHAVSLNYRDLMVASGNYLVSVEDPIIPCSDGAGEVLAVGPGVSRVQVGDRVAGSFFPYWIDGVPTPIKNRTGSTARPRRIKCGTDLAATSTACWPKKSSCTKTRWRSYRPA